jgi:hypothetical protein
MNDESNPMESSALEPEVAAPAPEAEPVEAAETVATQDTPPVTAMRAEHEALSTLRALGLRWADRGLGTSKALLQRGARALDGAAEKVGALQERVQTAQPARG